MIEFALNSLQSRSRHLRLSLENGGSDIKAARENLRLSLVELYQLGYWCERPDQFRRYMQLYRLCRCLDASLSVPPPTSAPGRRGRYNP